MSFKWLNKQGVESSEGYVLQRMHRFYYYYTEGECVMQIDVESSIKCTVIYMDQKAKWLPPHDSETIQPQRLADIQRKVSAALDFMETPHIFKNK